ncbi:DNA-dependent RNA polymerase RPO35 [Alphaentomopoxvirus acuprea]|uniref:DNA-dependent RNA polymerase RPO35 n=1 Tax=Alphaentomopoxvirus acuprea TaxID=62099 RepID=W6JPM0_9POXV|nr:DNA-dependent RNA polymerase RPO35 [Anomala cuprea entomopoxvirus]BAO49514.1 DNA-dependent RNA polymerase RPO35 [Anomala cuprea entomopoxvirus]
MEYECKVIEINLNGPIAYQIGTNIINIYNNNIRMPVLSKYILYAHELGTTFVNLVNNLQFVDLLYLFHNELNNLNNCGIRLKVCDDGKSKNITYNDLQLFVFDANGKIRLIKNPRFADKHVIWPITEVNVGASDCTYTTDILLFSSKANIENNYKLYNEILAIFDDYPIKNLEDAVQNSKYVYEYNMVMDKKPFNIKGFSYNNDYKIKIWFNHYYDINGELIADYICDIFEEIYKTFSTRLYALNAINIPFENKLIYSDITNHKNNYYLETIDDNIDKKIRDSVQAINRIPGINGIYLIPDKIELQEPDKFIEFFRKEIDNIQIYIRNHFKSLPYNYKS